MLSDVTVASRLAITDVIAVHAAVTDYDFSWIAVAVIAVAGTGGAPAIAGVLLATVSSVFDVGVVGAGAVGAAVMGGVLLAIAVGFWSWSDRGHYRSRYTPTFLCIILLIAKLITCRFVNPSCRRRIR